MNSSGPLRTPGDAAARCRRRRGRRARGRCGDRTHFAEFNRVCREFFTDCSPLPARTTVVARPVREGVLVEVDAVAVVG
ncbi:RidA family protein [Streptomyces sp. NPDC001492]